MCGKVEGGKGEVGGRSEMPRNEDMGKGIRGSETRRQRVMVVVVVVGGVSFHTSWCAWAFCRIRYSILTEFDSESSDRLHCVRARARATNAFVRVSVRVSGHGMVRARADLT